MEKEKWKSNFIEYSTRKRLTIVSSSCRGTNGKLIREEGFCHSHQTHQAWEDNPCFTLWKDNTKRDPINPTKHSKIDKPCFTSCCFPTLTWTIVHPMYKLTHVSSWRRVLFLSVSYTPMLWYHPVLQELNIDIHVGRVFVLFVYSGLGLYQLMLMLVCDSCAIIIQSQHH